MQRSRIQRFVVLLTGVVVAMVVVLEPAGAYVDTGRDGADAEAWFDIRSTTRRVWTSPGGHRFVTISVTGADAIYAFGPLKLRVRLDSRGGGLRDAILVMRNGDTASGQRRDCVVRANRITREGTLLIDTGSSETRKIACRIPAWILHPTKGIRWKVGSSQYGGHIDRAPDRGWFG